MLSILLMVASSTAVKLKKHAVVVVDGVVDSMIDDEAKLFRDILASSSRG